MRKKLGLNALVVVLLLVTCIVDALLTRSGRRPSVLLVISDDLRYDSMFSKNDTQHIPYDLPNIERLMASGVTFDNAFSNFASCSPSRQSFLTGRTPDALGVWNELDNFRQKGSAPRTLPQHLIQEGYTTISVGKVFHYDSFYGIDETFSWSETYFGAPSSSDQKCPTGTYFCNCAEPDCADYKIAEQATALLPRLANAHFAGNPFFLAIGFRRPHLDWRVPTSWSKASNLAFPFPNTTRAFPPGTPSIAYFACDAMNERGEVAAAGGLSATSLVAPSLTMHMRSAYWGSVSYMDKQLGKILDSLKRQNLDMETVVIFTSDHGYSLGERAFWCKQSLQDVAVRIPLVMAVPWLPRLAGARSKDTVELLDIYPTLTSLLSMKMPDRCLNGKDFSAIIESDVPEQVSVKNFAISTYPRCQTATGNTSTIPCSSVGSNYIVVMGYSIRTKAFRYTQWRHWIQASQIADWSTPGLVAVELYDHRLNVDSINPALFENDNLAGTVRYSLIEATLKAQLESVAKMTAYSNRRCGQVTPTTLPPGQQSSASTCTAATTVQDCASLFAYRCAWFNGYGCQDSTFCGFKTKDRVAKNKHTGKTPFGLPEGAPGCSLFTSRCNWKKNTCSQRTDTSGPSD